MPIRKAPAVTRRAAKSIGDYAGAIVGEARADGGVPLPAYERKQRDTAHLAFRAIPAGLWVARERANHPSQSLSRDIAGESCRSALRVGSLPGIRT